MTELAITNARIVLRDTVIHGSLLIRDGRIAAYDTGPVSHGEDFGGDYLIPGLVELHTDHFESHYRPRQGVVWNAMAALQSHDAQVAGAGITTVFDAVRIGSDPETGNITEDVAAQVDAVAAAGTQDRLRAEHYVHLRCELPSADCCAQFEAHAQKPVVRLASVMDHTPGARQYTTLEHYKAFYQKKLRLSDAEMEAYIAKRKVERERYSDANRQAILARGREVGMPFASHDDATLAHVEEAVRDGVVIAEFPTTPEAAQAAHDAGLAVLMGAPNVVRGKSHNGNMSATDLAQLGRLDVLSSDYVPFSLLLAGFLLPQRLESISLPQSIALVTANPAAAAKLDDRGEIAIGKRADLVRVRLIEDSPVVRSVWREGRRVN